MTDSTAPSRRDLLTMIGKVGGAAAMYQAMTALGHAAETQFSGPPVLSGAKPGASVVILGAGLAGMAAAYELQKAGYAVKILEFQDRPGGRNYSLRGGDTFTESDGTVQKVQCMLHPCMIETNAVLCLGSKTCSLIFSCEPTSSSISTIENRASSMSVSRIWRRR